MSEISLDWFALQEKIHPPGLAERASSVATAKFLYGLVSMTRPEHVVEVGTYEGTTTAWIARALIENGRGRCTSYDVELAWLSLANDNLEAAVGDDAPVELVCEDITRREEPVECDFAFIDPDPKGLYLLCFEKLKMPSDATLCAHDLTYGQDKQQVEALRDRLVASGDWEVIGFQQERGMIVARKRS